MKRLLHPLSYILLCVGYSSLAIALSHPLQLLWVLFLALLIDFREGTVQIAKRLLSLKKIAWLLLSIFIIQLIFRRSADTLTLFAFLKIPRASLYYAAQISLRIMIIFLSASSLSKLDFCLYRSAFSSIRLPEEISFMISYMAQLIPRFAARFKEESTELKERGLSLKKIGFRQKLTVYRILALATIAELILQSGRQSIALELRGFRSKGKTSSLYRHAFGFWDAVILLWLIAQIYLVYRISHVLA